MAREKLKVKVMGFIEGSSMSDALGFAKREKTNVLLR